MKVLETPPITRLIFLGVVIVTILVFTDIVSPYSLFLSAHHLRKLELWRILTNFLYFGKPTLDVFLHALFLFVCSLLFTSSMLLGIPFMANSLSTTLTYIWTRKNPRAIVQIFGFVSFPAFYLPFIVPALMLITARTLLLDDVLGILIGHIYYYFKEIYPKWGSDLLRTPCTIKKLFGEHPKECCKKTVTSIKQKSLTEGKVLTPTVELENETSQLNSTIADGQIVQTSNTRSVGIRDTSLIADSTLFDNDFTNTSFNSSVQSIVPEVRQLDKSREEDDNEDSVSVFNSSLNDSKHQARNRNNSFTPVNNKDTNYNISSSNIIRNSRLEENRSLSPVDCSNQNSVSSLSIENGQNNSQIEQNKKASTKSAVQNFTRQDETDDEEIDGWNIEKKS